MNSSFKISSYITNLLKTDPRETVNFVSLESQCLLLELRIYTYIGIFKPFSYTRIILDNPYQLIS